MTPPCTSVATQGSMVTSDSFRANRALWRARARTRIEGNITACKETTLLETAVGVGTIARPRAKISPTTCNRNKMADMVQRAEKLIFQSKIHFKRDIIYELENWATGKAVPIGLLNKRWQKAWQIQQKYGEEKYAFGRHYDRWPLL